MQEDSPFVRRNVDVVGILGVLANRPIKLGDDTRVLMMIFAKTNGDCETL